MTRFAFLLLALALVAAANGTEKAAAAKEKPPRLLERIFRKLRLFFEPLTGAKSSTASGKTASNPSSGQCPATSFPQFLRSLRRPLSTSARDAEASQPPCDPLPSNHSARGVVQLLNHTATPFFASKERRRPSKGASNSSSEAAPSFCMMMLVYAHFCPFSKRLAPTYVALARAFPQVAFYAIHVADYKRTKSTMSAIGVPRLIFFRKAKTVSIYNHSSKSFQTLKSYVHNLTGFAALENVSLANETLNATLDYGPFEFELEEFDVYLLLSWLFLIAVFSSYIFRSSHGERLRRRVEQLWLEHEHVN